MLTSSKRREMFPQEIVIVVHDGPFHADEVFSTALLEMFLNGGDRVLVIRTRDISDALVESATFIIDVGYIFDDVKHFDHHQDKGLDASNMLILRHLFKIGALDQDEYFALEPLFQEISNVDINKDDIHVKIGEAAAITGFKENTYLSGIIAYQNRMDPESEPFEQELAFRGAVEMAKMVIHAQLYKGWSKRKNIQRWNKGEKWEEGYSMYCDENILHWKDLAPANIRYFGCKSSQGYALLTKDSRKYPLPMFTREEYPSLIFRNSANFFASFKSKEDVLKILQIVSQ